jgi:hypothetical protein
MAVSLKHTTEAVGTDAGNGEIRKAQWNEEHTLTLATARLLGRTTAGAGVVEEISAGTGLALSGGTLSTSGAFTASGYTLNTARLLGRTTASSGAAEEISAVSGLSLSSGSLALASSIPTRTYVDPVIEGAITEDIFTISDGAAFEVDPSNGSIQLITLGASRTPKATNFAAGESLTLMVDDGSAYTLTWTDATFGASGVTWVGGTAPTLATTGYTVIELWKVSTQVYGALVGSVA